VRLVNRQLENQFEAAGQKPEHCAWFHSGNLSTLETIVFLMEGATAATAFTPYAGNAITGVNDLLLPDDSNERHDLTKHVAVSVTSQSVEVWSSDIKHELGKLLAKYQNGQFRAHFHHYPERVDLTLDDKVNGRMVLTGSWTHLNDECLHTAKAAVALAIGPAH
jgi:hypothetical protein